MKSGSYIDVTEQDYKLMKCHVLRYIHITMDLNYDFADFDSHLSFTCNICWVCFNYTLRFALKQDTAHVV